MSLLCARAPAANTAINKMKTVVLNRIVPPEIFNGRPDISELGTHHRSNIRRKEYRSATGQRPPQTICRFLSIENSCRKVYASSKYFLRFFLSGGFHGS